MAKPPFTKFHKGVLLFWGVGWTVLVSAWVAAGFDDRKFGGMFVVVLGAIGWAMGLGVLAIVGAVTRQFFAGRGSRTLCLLLIPLGILTWFLSPALIDYLNRPPANALPTGVVVGYLPEDFENAYESWHRTRGTYHVFRSSRLPGELAIGVLTPGMEPLPGRTVVREGWVYAIAEDEDYYRVARKIDGVYIEVVSDTLSITTLVDITASARYHSEWDVLGARD